MGVPDAVRSLLSRYRSTGADLPFGDPTRAHGVDMEGYFWRFTDVGSGRVLIALIGVNRSPRGPWATIGVATSPGDGVPARLVTHALDGAWADPDAVGARSDDAFVGDDRRLRVDVPGAHLDLVISEPWRWPHRAFGGSSVFQTVPGLNQYWHPWLLGGTASGSVEVDGDRWQLTGAQVYGEKNWGRGGFPESWWWGQAQGFADANACVAFAGGEVYAGPLRTEVTGLVVRLPGGRVVRLGNPGTSPVRARVADDTWTLRGRGGGWFIEVDAHAPLAQAHVLPVPLPAEHRNTPGALEHLSGELAVTVRRHGSLVWQGSSRLAGLEHGGLARTEAELARRGGEPAPRP